MGARLVEKTHLSAKGLLNQAREIFQTVKEPYRGNQGLDKEICITDCLMSALAMFKLKFPSLLQFELAKEEEPIKQNLKNLFGIQRVPSVFPQHKIESSRGLISRVFGTPLLLIS